MNLDSFIEMEKLNSKEVEQVKEYVESLKRSRHKQENEKCTFWQRGCNKVRDSQFWECVGFEI